MNDYIRDAIIKGIFETLQMTAFASLFAYIIGLPLGILLYVTSKGRIYENRAINTVVGAIVNVSRSLPFLILLVLLIFFICDILWIILMPCKNYRVFALLFLGCYLLLRVESAIYCREPKFLFYSALCAF